MIHVESRLSSSTTAESDSEADVRAGADELGRRKSTLAAFGADRRRHMDQIGCNTGDDAKLESAAARTGLGIAAVQPRASRGT